MKFLIGAIFATHVAVLRGANGQVHDMTQCGDNQSPGVLMHLDDEADEGDDGIMRASSGAPVSMRVHGEVNSDTDFGDVKLQFKFQVFNVIPSAGGYEATEMFELDLCADVTGVACPLRKGSAFEGIAYFNAAEIPKEELEMYELMTIDVVDRTVAPCVAEHVALICISNEKSKLELRGKPAIHHGLVNGINSHGTTGWTAEHSPRFDGYTLKDARRIAGGTVMRGQVGFEELPLRRYVPVHNPVLMTTERRLHHMETDHHDDVHLIKVFDPSAADDIPDNFDAREAFPGCAAVIGRVRDQSDCGSCWAFASTEAFNDRRCIALQEKPGSLRKATNPEQEVAVLSAEDTTACCHGFSCGLSMGCNGGQPSSAWKWFTRTGVVTGGDFGDIGKGTTCKPYEFQPCAHHVDPQASGYPACPDGEYPTPECRKECSESTFGDGYEADKKKAKEAYSLAGVEDIQRDMMKYGSVTAAFSVYADFLAYKSGVYKHVDGSYMGGHAVKIIGWGVDEGSGQDYWLVANSWNPSWGEGGLFRILRGVNECGIEGQIVAGEVL